MKAQLIAGQRIMDVHGQFKGHKHKEKHSLCEVDGKPPPLFGI
jgi:hypothetical protein